MTVRVERSGFRRIRIAAVAASAAVALVLSACGTKGGGSNTTAAGSPAAVSAGASVASSAAGGASSAAGGASSAASSAGAGSTASQMSSSASSSAAALPTGPVTVPAGFKACMVTDTGGIDDKSFNQSAWAGLSTITGGDKKSQYVQSKAESDYQPNINSLIGQKCSLLFTVGGLMANATVAAAKANPKQDFVGIDFGGNGANIKGLQYNTAQAGMLAGYLAAGYSKSGVVATYGGLKIGPVTIYMDGFAQGVDIYNKDKGKNVKLLGWDPKAQTGSFAGSFIDQNKGKQLATNFIQQNADVIFPVAGGTGLGSAAVAQAAGNTSVIWVDLDGVLSAPQYAGVFLATAEKHITGTVKLAVQQASTGKFDASDYVGTLANGGVGLSPYHDFDSKVGADLKAGVEQLKADIISGKVKATSPAQPKSN
ncbi:MAG: BMP family ABC transporter substrate-binding protein [Actinomycetota bacterium]|nr:BMP family ABC transporter substrate-binding protein [Actinomycetota bacterium]